MWYPRGLLKFKRDFSGFQNGLVVGTDEELCLFPDHHEDCGVGVDE